MPESEESNVTPLQQPSPAEVAAKVAVEKVELRDVENSLPRIAAELARSNALAAEAIRLQQMQLQLTTSVVDLLRGQMSNGPQVQMAMLDRFGEMFAPIMAMISERQARPPKLAATPTTVPAPPVGHAGPGTHVKGDPNEATPVEE